MFTAKMALIEKEMHPNISSLTKNRLLSSRERATEKLTTKEVHSSWELTQSRLRHWLYEKGRGDFFISLTGHCNTEN